MNLKLSMLTAITMAAFAANSVFCRLALIDSENNPISFTALRLLSGASMLCFFYFKKHRLKKINFSQKTLAGPLLLLGYALLFSLAYINIDAGTGALLLFASVQITMMACDFLYGNKLNTKETFGMLLAIAGFVLLLLPGSSAPPITASILMIISGICWGLYSLIGKSTIDPSVTTAQNFMLTVPACLALFIFLPFKLTNEGIIWAMLSGGVASGLGYLLWYSLLRKLSISTAAIVQLSVPALAALGGVLFVNEQITLQLAASSLLISMGIFIKVKA